MIFYNWVDLIDEANFINGTSHTGPVSVDGTGSFETEGLWNTINSLKLQYQYANGVIMDYKIKVPTSVLKVMKAGFRSISIATEAFRLTTKISSVPR